MSPDARAYWIAYYETLLDRERRHLASADPTDTASLRVIQENRDALAERLRRARLL